MRRILVSFLLSSLALLGSEGKAVYEKKCASCHELYHPLSKLEANFMEKNNTLLNLKAPTMNQMAYRVKNRIGDPAGDSDMHLMEIESFLSDYFKNPDKQKSVCLPEVLKYFEAMPPINLSDDELESIVNFIYEYDPKAFAPQTQKLHYEGYDKALQEAAAQNKMVLIFFSAKHCGYCKKMEREVMSDGDVVRALDEDFVVVKVDMDSQKSPIEFKPTLTPTFMFLTPQSKEIYRVPGAWPKNDFLEILKEAKAKAKEKAASKQGATR